MKKLKALLCCMLSAVMLITCIPTGQAAVEKRLTKVYTFVNPAGQQVYMAIYDSINGNKYFIDTEVYVDGYLTQKSNHDKSKTATTTSIYDVNSGQTTPPRDVRKLGDFTDTATHFPKVTTSSAATIATNFAAAMLIDPPALPGQSTSYSWFDPLSNLNEEQLVPVGNGYRVVEGWEGYGEMPKLPAELHRKKASVVSGEYPFTWAAGMPVSTVLVMLHRHFNGNAKPWLNPPPASPDGLVEDQNLPHIFSLMPMTDGFYAGTGVNLTYGKSRFDYEYTFNVRGTAYANSTASCEYYYARNNVSGELFFKQLTETVPFPGHATYMEEGYQQYLEAVGHIFRDDFDPICNDCGYEREVAKRTLKIQPDNLTIPFDGTVLQVTVETGTVLVDDEPAIDLAATFQATGSGFFPGKYAIALDAETVTIFDTENNIDATARFDVMTENSVLEIVPPSEKIPVLVQGENLVTPYTGNPREITAEPGSALIYGEPLPENMMVRMLVKGSGVEPGTYPMEEVTYGPYVLLFDTAVDNWRIVNNLYAVTHLPGSLTVEMHDKMSLTIKADNQQRKFDGSMQQVSVTTGTTMLYDEPLSSNLVVTFEAYGSGRLPGNEYPIVIDEETVRVVDTVTGADVTAEYELVLEQGVLTIPQGFAYAVLNPDEAMVEYTGEVLNVEVTTGTVFINDAPMSSELRVVFTAQGSGMIPWPHMLSCEDFRIEVIEDGTDISEYFHRYVNPGIMLIVPPEQKILFLIDPDDQELYYNGEEQSVSVRTGDFYTILNPAPNYLKARFVAKGSGTELGVYPVTDVPYAFVTIVQEDGTWFDVTDCYDIIVLTSYLTIRPARIPITIKPAYEVVVFDGLIHHATASSGKIVLLDGQPPENTTLMVTLRDVSGSGRLPGVYPVMVDRESVTIRTASNTDVTADYDISVQEGTLKIDNNVTVAFIYIDNAKLQYNGTLQHVEVTTGKCVINGTPMSPALSLEFIAAASQKIGDAQILAIGQYADPATPIIRAIEDGTDVTRYFSHVIAVPGKLTIAPAMQKLQITIQPENIVLPYTGQAPTGYISGNGTLSMNGTAVAPDPNGLMLKDFRITNVGRFVELGTYQINPSEWTYMKLDDWDYTLKKYTDVTSSFMITVLPSTLTIKRQITISPPEETAKFDGSRKHATGIGCATLLDGQPLPSNLEVTFTVTGSGRLPGEYPIIVNKESVRVMDTSTGADITENFLVTPQQGVLKISQNWDLHIQIDKKDLEYTGKLQHVEVTTASVTINQKPMSNELKLDIFATGKEKIGASPIMAGYSNFKISVIEDGTDITNAGGGVSVGSGTLTITPPAQRIPISIQPDDITLPFSSLLQTPDIQGTGTLWVNGEIVTPEPEALKLADLRITDLERFTAPGTYQINPSDWGVITLKDWSYRQLVYLDVTDYYDITILPCTLTFE